MDDDDDTLQCPSNSNTSNVGDSVILSCNWARCANVGRIVENGSTSRNPVIGIQVGQKLS